MSNLITNQSIDSALSNVKSSTKELDTLLKGLFYQIQNDYSHLSKLSYLMAQIKVHSLPIKTNGIVAAALFYLGVEFDSGNSKFKVNKNLTRSDIGDCHSILSFKGEKKETDPEAELRKALRSLAKKAIKLNWNSDQFEAQCLRAFEVEYDYLNK